MLPEAAPLPVLRSGRLDLCGSEKNRIPGVLHDSRDREKRLLRDEKACQAVSRSSGIWL
jgi:hypothetical protein